MQLVSIPTAPTGSTKRSVEPRLPSLFGRLSILFESYDHHTATLENLREMCTAIEIGRRLPAALEPNQLLSELRHDLSAHFAAEEGQAHFGRIARTRADLLPRVVDLKADHAGLLRALAHIELIATDTVRWTEVPPLVSILLTALADHERAEAELLEEFLWRRAPAF